MANYDWRDFQQQTWRNRFPEGVRGYEAWHQAESIEDAFRRVAEARQAPNPPLAQPCVFVSHRQTDVAQAERIAYLACQEGFDYWLDVYDPTLNGLPPGPSNLVQSVAVAAIIEMALLNSTQVLAVITSNTKGSAWVPYEYGRVKDPQPVSPQAACWVHNSAPLPLPEYLYLGVITHSESDIQDWLRSERQRLGISKSPCSWSKPIPAILN